MPFCVCLKPNGLRECLNVKVPHDNNQTQRHKIKIKNFKGYGTSTAATDRRVKKRRKTKPKDWRREKKVFRRREGGGAGGGWRGSDNMWRLSRLHGFLFWGILCCIFFSSSLHFCTPRNTEMNNVIKDWRKWEKLWSTAFPVEDSAKPLVVFVFVFCFLISRAASRRFDTWKGNSPSLTRFRFLEGPTRWTVKWALYEPPLLRVVHMYNPRCL